MYTFFQYTRDFAPKHLSLHDRTSRINLDEKINLHCEQTSLAARVVTMPFQLLKPSVYYHFSLYFGSFQFTQNALKLLHDTAGWSCMELQNICERARERDKFAETETESVYVCVLRTEKNSGAGFSQFQASVENDETGASNEILRMI